MVVWQWLFYNGCFTMIVFTMVVRHKHRDTVRFQARPRLFACVSLSCEKLKGKGGRDSAAGGSGKNNKAKTDSGSDTNAPKGGAGDGKVPDEDGAAKGGSSDEGEARKIGGGGTSSKSRKKKKKKKGGKGPATKVGNTSYLF